MNKSFKVVWNQTKNCYMVTSELAKRRTKAPKSGIICRTVIFGVLAMVLNYGAISPVFAANYNVNITEDSAGKNTYVIDDESKVGIGAGSVILGQGSTIYNSNSNGVAIGDRAYVNESGIAIGGHLEADEWTIEGQGDKTFGATAEGIGDIVIGTGSHALGNHSILLGSLITSLNNNVIAIGYGASVTADNSIAIGVKSEATDKNTVSIGNASLKRKIVNMAAGTSASDGATVGQIQTVTAGTNVTINTTTNENGYKNKEIVVNGTGTVTKNNTGLINGNTLYNEIRPADNGNYVNLNCKIS